VAPRSNIWSRAAAVAAATPDTRNRYVDFLRAFSICAVVIGHWLIAAPYVSGGELSLGNMLEHQPWVQWLTWVFQVMPVFFIVGGYSNGVSWNSARRAGRPYSEWLRSRLQRLVGPVLPLLALWAVLGVIAGRLGMSPEMVAAGSQMALIPIWFLAVYVGVVVLVPLTYAAWERYGLTSVAVLALAVVIDDVLFFAADFRAVGWLNYAFIWVAAHQLGYAWRDGYLSGPKLGLAWAIAGALVLVALVTLGPYPLSMVSVPGEEVSNTLPPKLPMLTLAVVQIGLLLSIEAPMRRWLDRAAPWTATVLVNGMIMTVFLWHLTASTLVIAGAIWLGDIGLAVEPGSGPWWAARPLWLGVYALGLVLFALAFMRFERGGGARTVAAWRQVVGAALVCGGLALLALHGIGGDGPLGLRLWVLLLPFAGAALAGVNPLGGAPARAPA
jgi:fucose 4-O-acetylase-like acetyltransferase